MAGDFGKYDVAVIGAGHAGVEAALVCARLGLRTALFTISLDAIANLPCNPSIGGTAKGHLVREIDALGGEMGKAADATFLQSRILNRGKGPAVHSLRVQTDRIKYHEYMKKAVESQDNLDLKQAEIVEIGFSDNNEVKSVKTRLGTVYEVKAAIICSGTYLNGEIHVGDCSFESGPDSIMPAKALSESLRKSGMTLRRFKTGTPARVHRRSIDFSKLEKQDGDEEIVPFSFSTKGELRNKVSCYIAYTNSETHKVIKENIHLSPMYSGRIEGVGPRYCPSIEDKIVRFSDKPRHQLFVEPMGESTEEMYLQGMSSSLPEEVQIKFLRTISGLENVEIMRNAYAIEYDCCDPTDLKPTLEFIKYKNLYSAGQFNGTSGYEEAAAQGLLAGINASMRILNRDEIVLDRASSYLGTLVDDLVTKGCSDPYRMLTSRSEYRLILRQDNADERLIPIGHKVGLVSDDTFMALQKKLEQIEKEIKRVWKVNLAPTRELNDYLLSVGTSEIRTGAKLAEILRRPQVKYNDVIKFDKNAETLEKEVAEQVELRVKYEGYIAIQLDHIKSMRKLETKLLPDGTDYKKVRGLRLEAAEKLNKIKPLNVGQAGRISGVNPADISVLLIWLEQNKGVENVN